MTPNPSKSCVVHSSSRFLGLGYENWIEEVTFSLTRTPSLCLGLPDSTHVSHPPTSTVSLRTLFLSQVPIVFGVLEGCRDGSPVLGSGEMTALVIGVPVSQRRWGFSTVVQESGSGGGSRDDTLLN